MKKRSRKISRIVALARSEERRSGATAGASRRKLDEQLARLGELNAYRQNYARLSGSMTGVSAAHLKDFQSFLAKLDQAVRAQQQIVQDSERNLEIHRRQWAAKRQRLESLHRVLDSYRDAETQHADRQQQRALDDLPRSREPYTDDHN